MSNAKRPKTFAELLVEQDEPISETQFEEYRMHLEQTLAAAARFERRVRITAIVAWLVAILLPLGLVVVDRIVRGMSPLPPIRLALPVEIHVLPGAIGNIVGVLYMTTMFFAWLIVLVYLIKSRPAFQRAREEYQAALFADLQRQLAELKRQSPAVE
jgi:hypothetical protein